MGVFTTARRSFAPGSAELVLRKVARRPHSLRRVSGADQTSPAAVTAGPTPICELRPFGHIVAAKLQYRCAEFENTCSKQIRRTTRGPVRGSSFCERWRIRHAVTRLAQMRLPKFVLPNSTSAFPSRRTPTTKARAPPQVVGGQGGDPVANLKTRGPQRIRPREALRGSPPLFRHQSSPTGWRSRAPRPRSFPGTRPARSTRQLPRQQHEP
jgi:hypothetical protein